MSKNGFICLLVLLLTTGCETDRKLTFSIFHWKSQFNPNSTEQAFLNNHQIQKIYVRYFDVKTEYGIAKPVAILSEFEALKNFEYVPSVYLVNAVLKGLNKDETSLLALNIGMKIKAINGKFGIAPKEVLLDCDWTKSSQEAFFQLIKVVEQEIEIPIISTIRLHQFKNFEKTGVPPVKRGILMMYNMGELSSIDEQNSIINPAIAKQYKRPFEEYPIKLEIALPIFSWLVLYRDGRPIELISNFDSTYFNNPTIFKALENEKFTLELDTFIFEKKRYKYDVFRLENSKNSEIINMVNDWKSAFPKDSLSLSFYDLRIKNIENRDELIEQLENTLL